MAIFVLKPVAHYPNSQVEMSDLTTWEPHLESFCVRKYDLTHVRLDRFAYFHTLSHMTSGFPGLKVYESLQNTG